jgi:hypothetical protein
MFGKDQILQDIISIRTDFGFPEIIPEIIETSDISVYYIDQDCFLISGYNTRDNRDSIQRKKRYSLHNS